MSHRRYLIFSDLHLGDIEDHEDGWKRYKSSAYLFDSQFDELVRDFTEEYHGDELVLVLNGDIVDFDLVTAVPDDPPWPISKRERKFGMIASEPKSVWKLQRMLDDHPDFVCTLTDFVGAGHRIVYVTGNHDMELYFPACQQTFRDVMRACADEKGLSFEPDQLEFETWFYYVPGELYVEHGQQYDYYSSFRYVLKPLVTVDGEERLAIPMGNMAGRQIGTQTGYFNIHAGDFLMSAVSWVVHWFKYYAFSRRSLLFTWLFGSFYVLFHLLRTKEKYRRPADYDELLQAQADRYGLSLETVQQIGKLQRPPITDFVFRILREFWLDRMAVMTLLIGGTIALALVDIPLWVKLMVPLTGFPLLFMMYESLVAGMTVTGQYKQLPRFARKLAQMLSVKAVAFGHTHLPQLVPLARNCSFVNSGTWAPMWKAETGELLPGYRNYIIVSSDLERGKVQVQLDSWQTPTGKPHTVDKPRNPLKPVARGSDESQSKDVPPSSGVDDGHSLPTPPPKVGKQHQTA